MSTLSKKHYIDIANIIKNCDSIPEIVDGLCSYFESDNERFKREKFIQACGYNNVDNVESVEDGLVDDR